MEQFIGSGKLVHKYGFAPLVKLMSERFSNFSDEFIKCKAIYSVTNGIIRFEFVVSDDVRNKIQDIETSLDKETQKEIYKKYTEKFNSCILDFITEELEILKKELEKDDTDNIVYKIIPSQYYAFTYLKNTGTLRLEFII